MKKLTAGIFTVLMGLVSVNAADAAVASKGYVDAKVGANTTLIESLSTTVTNNQNTNTEAIAAAKKAGTDAAAALEAYKTSNNTAVSGLDTRVSANETAISGLQSGKADKGTKLSDYGITDAYTKGETDDAIAVAVQGTMTGDVSAILGGYLKKTEAETLYETIAAAQATNNAQDTKITANTDALTVLNGNATVDGSVAKKIADAITALDLSNSYDAKGAAAQALTDAKAYADGLATNYDASGSAAQALTDAKAYADGLATNYDAAGSASSALAEAKGYTDTEIDKLEQSLNGTSTNLTELEGRVTANTNSINTINDSAVMKSGVTAETVSQVGTNATAITDINNSAAMKSGITSEKVSAYDAYAGQITSASNAADVAQESADDAAAAAAAAQATADKAIPAPTPECSNKGNKCVLTSGENGYAWEVIERGTGEVVE